MVVTIEVALELLERIEANTRVTSGWDHMLLLMLGGAVAIGFGGLLRGREIFLADLHSMRKHLDKGKVVTASAGSHIFDALLGKFKGKTGERYLITPLALVTALGLRISGDGLLC